MKKVTLFARICLLLVIIFLVVLMSGRKSLISTPSGSREYTYTGEGNGKRNIPPSYKRRKEGLGMELSVTGSSLPDCEHACGPCFPCKRVMVSFKCSSIAESCPTVYRCMCKGRYYHVPSN